MGIKRVNANGIVFVEKVENSKYIVQCPLCNTIFMMFACHFYRGDNPCRCRNLKAKNPRLYRVWENMNARCYTPSASSYKYYGARGISVCNEWRNCYNNFFNWACNNGYADNLSIDRIDVNGSYDPSNCRWATREEQNNNKRDNLMVNGVSLKRYCREHDINYKLAHQYHKYHEDMTMEKVVQYYEIKRLERVGNASNQ